MESVHTALTWLFLVRTTPFCLSEIVSLIHSTWVQVHFNHAFNKWNNRFISVVAFTACSLVSVLSPTVFFIFIFIFFVGGMTLIPTTSSYSALASVSFNRMLFMQVFSFHASTERNDRFICVVAASAHRCVRSCFFS